MNIALIFAGGTGVRMNSRTKPKQFLELHGKPIIIHTIDHFEQHDKIESIAVVCLGSWIAELNHHLERNQIKKIRWIVPGGETVQESIFNGLREIDSSIESDENPIILLHDGVRPLIDYQLISDNIECVRKNGNAVTVSEVSETISLVNQDGKITDIVNRDDSRIARAPQSFYLRDLLTAHRELDDEKKAQYKDTASLMLHMGYRLHTVNGPVENTKVTTAVDYYIFRALYEARENSQLFGM